MPGSPVFGVMEARSVSSTADPVEVGHTSYFMAWVRRPSGVYPIPGVAPATLGFAPTASDIDTVPL
jgi:hypothetical protein